MEQYILLELKLPCCSVDLSCRGSQARLDAHVIAWLESEQSLVDIPKHGWSSCRVRIRGQRRDGDPAQDAFEVSSPLPERWERNQSQSRRAAETFQQMPPVKRRLAIHHIHLFSPRGCAQPPKI